MKKLLSLLLFSLTLLIKKFGVILRGIGLLASLMFLFKDAIPDLKFNIMVGRIKTYTEKEIINTKKEELPLYLKISDVEAFGEMYVKEMYQKRHHEPTLSAIIYPVYNLQNQSKGIDKLKKYPCSIVVKDRDVKEKTLETYFDEKKLIEGKFDQSLIDNETKKLLTDAGYNISDQCIVLQKGVKVWSVSTCIFAIFGFGFLSISILLSFFSMKKLNKIFNQEEKLADIQ